MRGFKSLRGVHAPERDDTDLFYRIIGADDNWAARNSKANFVLMAPFWAPSCDEESLRVIVDWLYWVC
jgi:hypothetical protein